VKIINILPYRTKKMLDNTAEKRGNATFEPIEKMRERGQLEGVEMDVDEGYDIGDMTESRDEEFLARITLGNIAKIRQYSEMGKYDAIVCVGTMGMGFFAGRMISRIPVITSVHAGFQVASLIGDRFTLIEATDPQSLIARHWAQIYGFNEKLASVRQISHSSTSMSKLIHRNKKEERIKVPEIKAIIDDIMEQCIKAIENDSADTLILGCTPLQSFEDEVRNGLDEAGYEEIPLVCEFSAAVEMAKVMVNLGLNQAPRPYPGDSLKAKPEYR